MKRLAIYLKECVKPIIVSDTDDSKSLAETTEDLKNIFLSDKIYTIVTNTDCFIGRPSELQGILVSEDKNNNTRKYERSLSLDDKPTP